MLRKFVLSTMAVLAATAATLVAPGVATATTDGTGQFCNSSTGFCISMNGTAGNDVVNKTQANDNEEDTAVTGYLECQHDGSASEYVQSTQKGDGTNCPFTNTSFDNAFHGDEIVVINNIPSGLFAQSGADIVTSNGIITDLSQGTANESGELFVKIPGYYYVSVLASDDAQIAMYMCPSYINGGQVTTGSGSGADDCTWTFQ